MSSIRFAVIMSAVVSVVLRECESRSITRFGPSGNANLIEFNVRGTTYGKCSFVDDGQEVEVTYEVLNGNVKARASNPTILDPVHKTEQCREAAAHPPESAPSFRSDLGDEETTETPMELAMRFQDFRKKLSSNEDYVSQLQPRFFKFSNLFQNFIISFPETNQFPFSLNLPSIGHSSVGVGLPFKGGLFGR